MEYECDYCKDHVSEDETRMVVTTGLPLWVCPPCFERIKLQDRKHVWSRKSCRPASS